MEMDSQRTDTNRIRSEPGVRTSNVGASVLVRTPKCGFLAQARLAIIGVIVLTLPTLDAQTLSKTVHHHKVAVEDPSSPPELIEAESAIEKKDYGAAEGLLKKVVEADPANYAAWFDLGFVYNAVDRTE